MRENEITEIVIGCAIEVHRAPGPSLLESAYEQCLCYELSQRGHFFERQVELPIVYKAVNLACGYRMHLAVEYIVMAKIKAIEQIFRVRGAQLLSYLRLDKTSVDLLIKFNVSVLKHGIRWIVNKYNESSASQRLCVE